MPRITPLAEIPQLEADEIITCTAGTLKKLFEPKKGENSNGPWSIQHGTLEKDGASIELFIKDREPIPQTWRGREIIVSAHKGEKGWSGVYAYDDTYKGKTTRKVKITPTAEVALLDDHQPGTHEAPPAPPQKPTGQSQGNSKPAADSKPPADVATPTPNQAAARKSEITKCVAAATQIGNLQLLSLNTVENYVAPRFAKKNGRELTVDERHAWAMNMMIQLCRDNMQWAMPSHEIVDKKPSGDAAGQ